MDINVKCYPVLGLDYCNNIAYRLCSKIAFAERNDFGLPTISTMARAVFTIC